MNEIIVVKEIQVVNDLDDENHVLVVVMKA